MPQTPENYIRHKARSLPIYECWINKDYGGQLLNAIALYDIMTDSGFMLFEPFRFLILNAVHNEIEV